MYRISHKISVNIQWISKHEQDYGAQILEDFKLKYERVGTARINSDAGQSQTRNHPISNGRINMFSQQRSHPRFSVNSTRFHGGSSANTR
jgi:hypothetical protein